MPRILLVIAAFAGTGAIAHALGARAHTPPAFATYPEAVARVFDGALPEGGELPKYVVRPPFEVQAALGLLRVPGIELVARLRATTTDASDFKDRRVKVIHAMGACAEAVWKIDRPSPATGLLARGVSVPAIVRFSTGNNELAYRARTPRIFGFAVKVFPDPEAKLPTANLFLLDEFGLDGDVRPLFLARSGAAAPVSYLNTAKAEGAAKAALPLFGRFDSNPSRRPLYPFSETRMGGAPVQKPLTPRLIRLSPPRGLQPRGLDPDDFRTELLAYEPGDLEFEIVLPAQEMETGGVLRSDVRIGTLSVGKPEVSVACDQELHFHHHPTR